MTNIVLVGFKRSPFTIANKGLLSGVRPEDILSQVINETLKEKNSERSGRLIDLDKPNSMELKKREGYF